VSEGSRERNSEKVQVILLNQIDDFSVAFHCLGRLYVHKEWEASRAGINPPPAMIVYFFRATACLVFSTRLAVVRP
jgi:hypothetical protein